MTDGSSGTLQQPGFKLSTGVPTGDTLAKQTQRTFCQASVCVCVCVSAMSLVRTCPDVQQKRPCRRQRCVCATKNTQKTKKNKQKHSGDEGPGLPSSGPSTNHTSLSETDPPGSSPTGNISRVSLTRLHLSQRERADGVTRHASLSEWAACSAGRSKSLMVVMTFWLQQRFYETIMKRSRVTD